ncbi:MAG TPA: hypothetical protein ENI86_02360 [Acidimicrobiales bacterium]|nr:hypothetical protein [Acidimicrobiales bacterium]
MRRSRLLPILAMTLALLAAACGGGSTADGSAGDSAAAVDGLPVIELEATPAALVQAAERTADTRSFRFSLVGDVTTSDLPIPLTFSADGGVDLDNSTFYLNMDFSDLLKMAEESDDPGMSMVSAFFGDGQISVVDDGEYSYVKMAALAAMMGADTDWIRSESGSDSGLTSGFLGGDTGSPDVLMEQLSAAGEVTEVGREDVRGVGTTHFEVKLDPAKLAEMAGTEGDLGLGTSVDAPVQVWVDDQGLLRRMEMQIDDATGSGTMVFEMFDFGKPIEVEVPGPGEYTDESELGGLFGE